MGTYLIKLPHAERPYVEWSTSSDRPCTVGMSEKDLRAYIRNEYGAEGMRELPERLARIERSGTSACPSLTPAEAILCNRAGAGETRLTMAQIVDFYCERRGSGPRPVGVRTEEEDDG